MQLALNAAAQPTPPANLDAFDAYLRGRALLQATQSDAALGEAVEQFSRAIAADPDYADAYAGLCDAYLALFESTRATDNIAKARSACDEAYSRRRSGPTYVALGNLYRVSGQYRKAQRHFRKAIEANPYDVDAYAGKARTYASQGKFEHAEKTLARTLEIQPNFWRGHLELGNLLFDNGQYDDAIPYYQRVVDQLPDSARAFNNLGAAQFMTGQVLAVDRGRRL